MTTTVVTVNCAEDVEQLVAKVRELLVAHDLDVEVRTRPKAACAAHCTMAGPGLEAGEVDIPAQFTVQAADNAGRPLDHGGVPFAARCVGPSGREAPVALEDRGDGTYGATYTPAEPGLHRVEVTLAGDAIRGCADAVPVAPPTPDPAQCTADGPGVDAAAALAAGVAAPFRIVARNRAGMQLRVGGHDFAAALRGPFESRVQATVVDNGDGTYDASYVPLCGGGGAASVAVTVLGGQHIARSPFAVTIAKNPAAPDAERSFAFGPGVDGGCDTADPATFTVQAVTPAGEKCSTGGAAFEAVVTDVAAPKGANKLPATIVDNGDGTYSGSYQPLRPGKHKVAITLRSPTEPMFFEHIAKSPYQLDVLPGLDPSKCRIDGEGVTSGQVDDVHPTTFTIHAVDFAGHDITKGGETFDVSITGPDGTPVERAPATATDNNDGTYTVEWATTQPGKHTVAVTRKGKAVAASPYTVDVTAGSDEDSTSAGVFGFTVHARDRRGEPITHGGSRVECIVRLDEAGSEPVEGVVVRDNGDGSYTAHYKLEDPGVYLVDVLLNGRRIKGCPFKQHIVL